MVDLRRCLIDSAANAKELAVRAGNRPAGDRVALDAHTPWLRGPWVRATTNAAAAAIVLAGCALVSCVSAPANEPNGVTRDGAVVVVKPTTEAAFDRTFAWQRVDAATSYLIVVSISNGDRIFELRDLKVPSVRVDESVKLIPGRYFWQVTALRNDAVLAQSPLTEFTIP